MKRVVIMGLNNFILECEKDNKKLREDIKFYKNKNIRLSQENQQLKERVEYLERSNDRREETILSLRNEQQLDLYKSVIDELTNRISFYKTTEWCLRGYTILENFEEILDKVNINGTTTM